MLSLFKKAASLFFGAFVTVIFLWTASLTLAEVRQILPGDPVTPYFALALFDGGAVVWLLVFVSKAEGLWQRTISGLALVADLIGVVAISMAQLLSGGQELTTVSPEMGAAVVYGVGIMTALNFLALYGFHITDPETLNAIEDQSMADELLEDARKTAKANFQSEKGKLSAILAARTTAAIKERLYLPITDNEALAMAGVVIDGEVIEDDKTDAVSRAKKSGIPAWLLAGLRNVGIVKPEVKNYAAETNTPQAAQPTPKKSDVLDFDFSTLDSETMERIRGILTEQADQPISQEQEAPKAGDGGTK